MVSSPLVCSYIRNEHLLGSNCRAAGFFQRGQGGASRPRSSTLILAGLLAAAAALLALLPSVSA